MYKETYPIDIQTLLPDSTLSFDLFSVENETLELCCAGGENFSEKKFDKHLNNNSNKLFIRARDKKHYYSYLEEILDSIIYSPSIKTSVKAKALYNTISNVSDELFSNPTQELVRRFKQISIDLSEFILFENDALKSLMIQTSIDFSISNHSINVGIYSTCLARELLENVSTQDFEEITAGFFLHDIGKTSISLDILNKKNKLLKGDWVIIKKHPEEGVRIIDDFQESSVEIKTIILQHHERHHGGGYPFGLRGQNIHIYSKICSIADTFDALTSYRPYRKEKSTFSALKLMKEEMFKDFDPEFFLKFIKLLSK